MEDHVKVTINAHKYVTLSVEINSVIAYNTVGATILNTTRPVILFHVNLVKLLSNGSYHEHAGHVAQQMVVLNVNFCWYVKATEFSLIYDVSVFDSYYLFKDFEILIMSIPQPIVGCTHTRGTITDVFDSEDK